MKLGVVLPTFRDRPDEAFAMAHRAEQLGIHGAFCFDHLWPMGRPGRPALAPFPILGRLAATTTRLVLGTLVARVGLAPPGELVRQLCTLALLAPGRVIAGLGTGDHLSAPENQAYGIDYPPAAVRLAELRRCAEALRDRGVPVWLGGRATTTELAHVLGVAANLWGAEVPEVAAQATRSEVTWAGPVPPEGVAAQVAALQPAGPSWAVFSYPVDLEELAEVAALAEVAGAGAPAPSPGRSGGPPGDR